MCGRRQPSEAARVRARGPQDTRSSSSHASLSSGCPPAVSLVAHTPTGPGLFAVRALVHNPRCWSRTHAAHNPPHTQPNPSHHQHTPPHATGRSACMESTASGGSGQRRKPWLSSRRCRPALRCVWGVAAAAAAAGGRLCALPVASRCSLRGAVVQPGQAGGRLLVWLRGRRARHKFFFEATHTHTYHLETQPSSSSSSAAAAAASCSAAPNPHHPPNNHNPTPDGPGQLPAV